MQEHADNGPMTPTALMDSLRARGCTLSVDSAGKLHVVPRKLLQPDETKFISEHRDEIVQIVQGKQQPQDESASSPDHSSQAANSTEGNNGAAAQGELALPQANVLEGSVIKLAAAAEQLKSLSSSIAAIRGKTAPICGQHPDHQPTFVDGHWYCEQCIDPQAFEDVVCSVHPCARLTASRHDDGGITLTCEAATHMFEQHQLLAALDPALSGRLVFAPGDALRAIGEEIASLEAGARTDERRGRRRP